ncbi:MAG: ABC transporter ATP-binding protein [Planctomycetaceae bacterium]|nr:ABC transporter ATP-binding protein [Planctomycetaceae bacterium]
MAERIIQFTDLLFAYKGTTFQLELPEFRLDLGERVALIGRSGCGKSTLLDLACGIKRPRRGQVAFDGANLAELGEPERRRARLCSIGLVFQEFRLLEYLSVLDSILLPVRLAGNPVTRDIRDRARELANRAGIAHLLKRRPHRLSQGERQRAAICRALVSAPKLVLADEPTGNLDPDTGEAVLDLLFEEVRNANAALLVVTHDHVILPRFDRVVDLTQENRAGNEAVA